MVKGETIGRGTQVASNDPANSDPAKSGQSTSGQTRPEAAKPATAKPATAKPDSAKPQHGTSEPVTTPGAGPGIGAREAAAGKASPAAAATASGPTASAAAASAAKSSAGASAAKAAGASRAAGGGEPVDDPAPAAPGGRRRPVTLDLPAKDLTPPSPVPPSATAGRSGGAASGAASTTSGAASAAAATKPRRSLGLVSGAVLALVSGALGAAFAVAVVNTFYSAEQNVDALTELEARALDLRQRVDTLEARAQQAPAAQAPATGDAAPDAALAERLTALENGLTGLGTKVNELASAPPAANAPAASPEALQQLEGRVAGMEEKVAALTALNDQVSSLGGQVSTLNGQVSGLSGQVSGLGGQIGALAALPAKVDALTAERRDNAAAAAGLSALAALRAALAEGTPYEPELAAARKLLGDKAAPLSGLEASAATGLPTGPALAERLKAAFAAAPEGTADTSSAAAPADAGIVDKLLASASSLVTVRRTGDGAAQDAGPAVAAADAALMRGDVAEALTALGGLPDAEKQKLAAVIGAMEARQQALTTVAQLNRQLIADIAGRAP